MKDFKDKVMFITGAAHGFGRVIAEEGAKRGMKLALVDIDKPALNETYQIVVATGADAVMLPKKTKLTQLLIRHFKHLSKSIC